MWAPGTAAAIRRSATIYLRDADRRARMERLLARFVRPGGLAFDIGAHLGDRAVCFARLGARVVALEPQPAMFRALRLLMRGRGEVSLLNAAAGAKEGQAEMFLNTANPTVSSLSAAFVAAGTGPGWAGERWDRREMVPVVTLDTLIARHGLPYFVKIDVEGHEAEALRGLSRAIQGLSFEVTSIRREVGHECLDRLAALGTYRYNLSLGETHRLRYTSWIGPNRMRREIDRLSHADNSADIYGILRPSAAP